ncbi:MAG: phosphoribosylamine--glycine ligase [Rhodothermales bacterium]|nr:phosphoribosylamine--glycine ligase [Rhodothermales bacterium]
MKVLVVGSGGREHAIAWKLTNCNNVDSVFVAPGNPGTKSCAENVAIAADDIPSLLEFARRKEIDITIVGPEKPLVDGIVDRFREASLAIVGPTASAARLEGSKAFAKDFMKKYGVPTATYKTFSRSQYQEATAFLDAHEIPVVIKASGLAAGKGAVVCATRREAEETLRQMLHDRAFGSASDEVVIEEFMVGEEASVFALCDGESYVLFSPAQDHKQIGEGDTGPNTGGMGAYAPASVVTEQVLGRVRKEIIDPVLEGMSKEGCPFTGFLFVGLMLTEVGPKVVEFNCRLGDPETQVILPLLETNFADLLRKSATENLNMSSIDFHDGNAACVVMASGGYPGSYRKGVEITGLEEANSRPDTIVFQAGTANEDGRLVTAGGRVLNVVGTGTSLSDALTKAYSGIETINFERAVYRRDIGKKGLKRQAAGIDH